jgi:hypothetical protein
MEPYERFAPLGCWAVVGIVSDALLQQLWQQCALQLQQPHQAALLCDPPQSPAEEWTGRIW